LRACHTSVTGAMIASRLPRLAQGARVPVFFSRERYRPQKSREVESDQGSRIRQNPDTTRVASIIYLLLRRSPLMVETSHPRVHRYTDTRAARSRADTHARCVISYAFDSTREMLGFVIVASTTSRRRADSNVRRRFLEWRTSDVAREHAVRHPALDWLLCLVNRNSWAAERWRWRRGGRPYNNIDRIAHARCPRSRSRGPTLELENSRWRDAHSPVAFKPRTRKGVWLLFRALLMRIWSCSSKQEIHETSIGRSSSYAAN